MRRILYVLVFFITFSALAQIRGKITDQLGEAVPFVSIYVENTFEGTASNEKGEYELKLRNYENEILVFKRLGYKTVRIAIPKKELPITLDVVLVNEDFVLDDIVIHADKNPADEIIKNAIANKKKNTVKTSKFTVDFYSKGNICLLKTPKFIKIGMTNGEIAEKDSTNTGIIYLSETMSKVTYQKPNKIKEKIIASKVSGNNQGYSLNTARDSFFDFYDDLISLNEVSDIKMISPLSKNAFSFYKYYLEASFYDGDKYINKIKVSPKRDKEPVFEGYIYIVEDSWAIYGVEFDILGYRIQEPILKKTVLVQNYSYNTSMDIWTKNLQTLEAVGGIFGVEIIFKFSYIFSNYNFVDSFEKKTFSNEITTFEADANKKDNSYWDTIREIPLTADEVKDYRVKDSIQTYKSSPAYIDSLDRANNKFKVLKILTGYTYRNTPKEFSLKYGGLSELLSTDYNIVQGLNLNSYLEYTKSNKNKGYETNVRADFNYGFIENKLRVKGYIDHRFNKINNSRLLINGGNSIEQFNGEKPIFGIVNSVTSLFFKKNYKKLYNKEFVKVYYGQNVFDGAFLSASLEYAHRKPLFNNTNFSFFYRNREYTSNNPLEPNNFLESAFDKHNIFKAKVSAKINFGQEYLLLPNKKIILNEGEYPTVNVDFEKGYSSQNKAYNYNYISASVEHEFPISNKGFFSYNIKGGKFFNATKIAFMDYHHFRGNQTYINLENKYKNAFNLLPYYELSTNKEYLEIHLQHNFKGFIMNKIPLINKLQWNLVLGYNNAITTDRKPYNEFSVGFSNIGIKKFNLLRVDYVRSYHGGKFLENGVVLRMDLL